MRDTADKSSQSHRRGHAALKRIVERNDTPWGRRFDLGIMFLILFSLISFSIETLPNLSPRIRNWLHISELIVMALFTIEYILRVAVADKKLHFILSFYGLVDILAIVPFFVAGLDLRAIRIFRLFRIIRLLKLLRYSQAIRRFQAALVIAKEELILFIVMAILLLWLSAVGIYYFENDAQPEAFGSVFHSLWWAVVTLTTVGYGDVYPVTVWGRIFASVVLLLGLGVVAVPAGLVASSLTKVRQDETAVKDG